MTDPIEAVANAIKVSTGCGLTLDDKGRTHVLCTDPRLPADYRRTQCDCLDAAYAAIAAYTKKVGGALAYISQEHMDDLKHFGAIHAYHPPVSSRQYGAFQVPIFAAPPAPAVRVKPLVWERPEGWTCDRARSILGEYTAWNGYFCPPLHHVGIAADDPKAAAQADYEARILSALESAPQPAPAGWMPIETAPKDGTIIDVWTKSGERMTDVSWSKRPGQWQVWRLSDFDTMGFFEITSQPTHWMPLSAAPEPEAGE